MYILHIDDTDIRGRAEVARNMADVLAWVHTWASKGEVRPIEIWAAEEGSAREGLGYQCVGVERRGRAFRAVGPAPITIYPHLRLYRRNTAEVGRPPTEWEEGVIAFLRSLRYEEWSEEEHDRRVRKIRRRVEEIIRRMGAEEILSLGLHLGAKMF